MLEYDYMVNINKLKAEVEESIKQHKLQKENFCNRIQEKYKKQFSETPELQKLMDKLRNLK